MVSFRLKNMLFAVLVLLILLPACANNSAGLHPCGRPGGLICTNGFSFANYDFLMITKSDSNDPKESLHGLDLELGNILSQYSMKVVGDKEFEKMPPEDKKRTIIAHLSLPISRKSIISVSLEDALSGQTVVSISRQTRGNMLDAKERTKNLNGLANIIVEGIKADKR